MTDFCRSLQQNDLPAVRAIPKSDLHNHCLLGGRLEQMEKFYGKKLEKFSGGSDGVEGINKWIDTVYLPVIICPGAFPAAVEAAFIQAKSDGVRILEMSIDVTIGRILNLPPETIIDTLMECHQRCAPEIEYRPELGMARSLSVRTLLSNLEPYLDKGFFKSIDLYDLESAQSIKNFTAIYRYVKSLGMKCKAHAGEFGSAEDVREAAETLELDAIQHGIGAVESEEVMKWLSKNKIQLNICPQSNIVLKRVNSYRTHPVRILFDHGVRVTINTDDVMLFDTGNSEQFLELYRCGLFSAEELDEIRENGL